MAVLVLNKHPYRELLKDGSVLLPVPPDERVLLSTVYNGGLDGHDPADFPTVSVCDFTDEEEILVAARWLASRTPVTRVVAVHEKLMGLAARLREELGCGGQGVASTTRFRDKVVMKQTLLDAGYESVPQFQVVSGDLAELPWDGSRFVVKSAHSVGASEVRIVADLASLNAARRELAHHSPVVEVEEFVDGDMYHCDAVVEDGRVTFVAVCRYLAAPGAFAPGTWAGSQLLPGGPLRDRMVAENARVLGVLGLEAGVTHLEFFLTPDGDLVFCEVAARPGGGGIVEIVRAVHGVDLRRAAFAVQCGRPAPHPEPQDGPPLAAVVGVYPTDGAPADLAAVVPAGTLEYVRGALNGSPVRHCTDYAHRFVIGGRTEDELADLRRQITTLVDDRGWE